MARWLLILGILGACKSGIAEEYDNHTLLRFHPMNQTQLEAIQQFNPFGDIEVLKHSRGINDSMDVLVPPDKMHMVHDYAYNHSLPMETKPNYGRKFEESIESRSARRKISRGNPAFEYHSSSAISNILENWERSNGDLLRLEYLGKSYEGRDIKLAKISSNPSGKNPIIFVDAGIHAREWAAPAMALFTISRLLDPAYRTDLDGIDWYILPLVNPDGYEYNRKHDRMWRKTRSKNANCYGVDGNRNYGFKWAVSGVSHNPCDKETYAGPKAFSEPETRLVKKVMVENSRRIKLYVSLHAYGQYLVYPWGYTGERLPREWQKLDRMAKIASAAVVQAGGPPFKVLSAGKWYPAAGGSDDFAFSVGIPYSYTMEITDGHEFIYPQALLPSSLPKLYHAFRAMASEIKNEFPARRVKRDLEELEGLADDSSMKHLDNQMNMPNLPYVII